jgi:hypothetical protein
MKNELTDKEAILIRKYLLKDKSITIKEIKTLYNKNVIFRLSTDLKRSKLSFALIYVLLNSYLTKNQDTFFQDYQICEINKIF